MRTAVGLQAIGSLVPILRYPATPMCGRRYRRGLYLIERVGELGSQVFEVLDAYG